MADSGSDELQRDRQEMASLLQLCKRSRVRRELEPWLARMDAELAGGAGPVGEKRPLAELEADLEEGRALLQLCSRTRNRQELQPWLSALEAQIQRRRGAAAAGAAAGAAGVGAAPGQPAVPAVPSAPAAPAAPVRFAPPPRSAFAALDRTLAEQRWRWLEELHARRREEVAKHAAGNGPTAAEGLAAAKLCPSVEECALPAVVIAGTPGAGQLQLLGALADRELASSGRVAAVTEVVVLENRYYTARVLCCLVDLEGAEAMPDGPRELLRAADAVVLLWDLAAPETFGAARQAAEGAGLVPAEGDDSAAGEEERVLLCVAVEGEAGSGSDAAEDEARCWCAEHGFEHLRCSLGERDLERVRSRRRGARRGSFGGLLGEDTDATPLRILEALECHPWPNLEKKGSSGGCEGSAQVAPAPAPALATAASEPSLPLVAFVVSSGLRHARAVVQAIAGSGGSASDEFDAGEVLLETKYYRARLRLAAYEVPAGGAIGDAVALSSSAVGLVMLWDVSQPETLSSVQSLFDTAWPGAADVDGEAGPSCAVRLCVAVDNAAGQPAAGDSGPLLKEAEEWCAARGVEHLLCSLGAKDLQGLASRWSGDLAPGARLLSEEDAGALRIAEAIECHAWPGLEPKQPPQRRGGGGVGSVEEQSASGAATPVADAAAAPLTEAPERRDDRPSTMEEKRSRRGEDAVEAIERLAGEMRGVREITDEARRRERACELAMQLADSLGVDSDEDEDE